MHRLERSFVGFKLKEQRYSDKDTIEDTDSHRKSLLSRRRKVLHATRLVENFGLAKL
jgi:hypothetical protein